RRRLGEPVHEDEAAPQAGDGRDEAGALEDARALELRRAVPPEARELREERPAALADEVLPALLDEVRGRIIALRGEMLFAPSARRDVLGVGRQPCQRG